MKAIQMFFEMMVKYQEVKHKLKCNYEEFRVHIRLYYAEKIKEMHK